MERTDAILSFLKEIDKFKSVEREIYLPNRKENSAEHSWHVAMFLLLFEKELPKLDFKKTLKLALIHDLIEIYAGDTFAFDKTGQNTKQEREKNAAQKLFSQLPDDLCKEYTELFNEYEEEKTPEAKTVKSFDKIQPILQNVISEGKSWKKHNVKYEDVDNYKRKHMQHDQFILSVYEKLIKEAKEKKLL